MDILLDGTQETSKILLGFCPKDGYEETSTDTNLMPLQIFHLVTEQGENDKDIHYSILDVIFF